MIIQLDLSTCLYECGIGGGREQVEARQQQPAVARLLARLYLQEQRDGATRCLGALVAGAAPDLAHHQSRHLQTERRHVAKLVAHVRILTVAKHLQQKSIQNIYIPYLQ